MGIIIKQSIKGSIWSYLGVGIGFVTTAQLYPRFLTTNMVGLFGLLISYSALFAQFSSLGFHGITNRLFPYFRDKNSNHNGYILIGTFIILIGFSLFLLFFSSFKPVLIENNIEKSRLFSEHINLLLPLTFFALLFIQLDMYSKMLYNAVIGIFSQDFLQRLLIFISTLLYIFKLLTIDQFIYAFTFSVSAKGIVILFYLLLKGEIKFKYKSGFISKKLRNEMFNVAIFNIISGIGGSLIFNIDKIIINHLLGLSQTGIYTIAFFFGTLVIIPSRPLLKVSGTLIAEAFKRNDLHYISDIYKKSCINQLVIGAFLFGGIWINIDNILQILGPDYIDSKWVIFFIGLGYLFDMATGANNLIILYSQYYRVNLLFIMILLGFVVLLMYLLVPYYGIVGAAIAISLSLFLNNTFRYFFILKKLKMQPFRLNSVVIILFMILLIFGLSFLPKLSLIGDIALRSTIYSVIFIVFTILNRLSEDINQMVNSKLSELRKKSQ